MERIWSPWRSQYIQSFNAEKADNSCFICTAVNSKGTDKEHLIVARRPNCIVLMNKYPYNSGHLLVCPERHLSDFQQFTLHELTTISETIKEMTAGMQELFHPQGYNIGINVGQAAGAGLPQHLHFHIVPRWNGDSNFTATIADMKVFPEAMENNWKTLHDKFATYTNNYNEEHENN